MDTSIPEYPPWQHLPAHLIALYWLIMALKRNETYKKLMSEYWESKRKGEVIPINKYFHPCPILGRTYTLWELEWVFKDLTQTRKITTVMHDVLTGQEFTETLPSIDPREYFRTVGKDVKFLSHESIKIHLGEPPEILLEKIIEARECFFRDNPHLSKEMFLDWRDVTGRLILNRYDFCNLELSFKIFDMRERGLKYGDIIDIFGREKKQFGLYERSVPRRVSIVRSKSERSLTVTSLPDFLSNKKDTKKASILLLDTHKVMT